MKSSIFKDTFTYNAREALEDFEAGQASVAENMKSSFANAFQSIASGADSVEGAFANMAQSILNSISQICKIPCLCSGRGSFNRAILSLPHLRICFCKT